MTTRRRSAFLVTASAVALAAAATSAPGAMHCRGAFEPLPAGRYTFKITFSGQSAANVTLTVRW